MKRVAILIGSGKSKYGNLAGPAVDVGGFQGFLQSPHGGAWEVPEIIPLESPTEWDLGLALAQCRGADLSLVLFSGHGAMNEQGRMVVCLNDDFEPDVSRLRTAAGKELLIVDACRSLPSPSPAPRIKVGADTGAIEDRRYRLSCKRVYEDVVSRAAETVVGLFSCSPGENSFDFEGNEGGIFSRTLLDHCHAASQTRTLARLSSTASQYFEARRLFPMVAKSVTTMKPGQRPQIVPPASTVPSLPIVVW